MQSSLCLEVISRCRILLSRMGWNRNMVTAKCLRMRWISFRYAASVQWIYVPFDWWMDETSRDALCLSTILTWISKWRWPTRIISASQTPQLMLRPPCQANGLVSRYSFPASSAQTAKIPARPTRLQNTKRAANRRRFQANGYNGIMHRAGWQQHRKKRCNLLQLIYLFNKCNTWNTQDDSTKNLKKSWILYGLLEFSQVVIVKNVVKYLSGRAIVVFFVLKSKISSHILNNINQ